MRDANPTTQSTPYKPIYRDIFELHTKHQNAGSTDDCIALAEEAATLSEKYGAAYSPFVSALLHAVVNEIERVYLERRDANDRGWS